MHINAGARGEIAAVNIGGLPPQLATVTSQLMSVQMPPQLMIPRRPDDLMREDEQGKDKNEDTDVTKF